MCHFPNLRGGAIVPTLTPLIFLAFCTVLFLRNATHATLAIARVKQKGRQATIHNTRRNAAIDLSIDVASVIPPTLLTQVDMFFLTIPGGTYQLESGEWGFYGLQNKFW